MPVDVSRTVAALDELQAAIQLATREAVADAAEQIQRGARERVAKLSGELAASIRIEGPLPAGPSMWSAKIGPTTVYGRIQEIGGPIPGRRTVMSHPYLRWYSNGRPVFKRKVHHPARPYLRPAAEAVDFDGICRRHWADAILSVTG